MASVLAECGMFSENLMSIAEAILESKKLRGEQVNEYEKQKVEEKVFLSYQTVLSIAQDAKSIGLAVKDLEKAVSDGNTDVDKLAPKVAQKAVDHVKGLDDPYTVIYDDINVEDVMRVTDAVLGESNNGNNIFSPIVKDREEAISKIFDNKSVMKVNNLITKMKAGNFRAKMAFQISLDAAKFLGKCDPNEMTDRDWKEAMILLKRADVRKTSTTCYKLKCDLARTLGLDVFEIGENGEEVFNSKKLDEVIAMVTPDLAGKPDEFYEEINQMSVELAEKFGKYEGLDDTKAEEIISKEVEKSKYKSFKLNVRRILRDSNSDISELIELAEGNKEYFENFLNEHNKVREKILEEGTSESINQVEDEIKKLKAVKSYVWPDEKENTFNQNEPDKTKETETEEIKAVKMMVNGRVYDGLPKQNKIQSPFNDKKQKPWEISDQNNGGNEAAKEEDDGEIDF